MVSVHARKFPSGDVDEDATCAGLLFPVPGEGLVGDGEECGGMWGVGGLLADSRHQADLVPPEFNQHSRLKLWSWSWSGPRAILIACLLLKPLPSMHVHTSHTSTHSADGPHNPASANLCTEAHRARFLGRRNGTLVWLTLSSLGKPNSRREKQPAGSSLVEQVKDKGKKECKMPGTRRDGAKQHSRACQTSGVFWRPCVAGVGDIDWALDLDVIINELFVGNTK